MRAVRVGLFGGTFDPPHLAHLVVATHARRLLELHEVRLVVAHDPWQKTAVAGVSPAAVRLEMCRAAVEPFPGLAVSDVEVRRGGPTYTIDTVEELLAAEPGTEPVLIVGADAAAGLPTWRRSEDLARLVPIAVVPRPGAPPGQLPAGFRGSLLDVPELAVSSSQLRQRMAAGLPVDVLVPEAVVAVARSAGLYGLAG